MSILHTSPSTSHRWTTRFTVSLSAMIALFGTWGWLTHYGLLPRELALVAGGVLMAGVCLVAQGVCNNMAVEARRARARGLKWSFGGALVVALGFGAVSAMGLHHGWEIAKAVVPTVGVTPPPDWLMTALFVFIAFGEPLSFWIVEAVRSVGDQPQPATSKQPVDARQKKARGWSPRLVETGAVGAVAAAALAFGGPGDAAAQPAARTWLGEVAKTESDVCQGPDNRAKVLADSGWSERRIALECSTTRHAIRRLLGRATARRVGSTFNDYLVGGVANNILQGFSADDILEGHGGDDLLDGGDGNDQMNGGTGGDIFDGGAGFDTVRYDGAAAGVIAFMSDAWANTGEAAGDAYISIEALYGSNFNDTLAGASNANELQGFDGTDFIYGYSGNDFIGGGDGGDYLDGGAGTDQLQGGAGADQFIFRAGESSGDAVLDFAGNGAAAGDNLLFIGYGTAGQGATFTQLNATQWQITSADGLITDIITLTNGASVDASDYGWGS